MAEVLVEYPVPVLGDNGVEYLARACGAESENGHWQGWLEFTARNGCETLRSARETTQPNRRDTLYWATGLRPVYLEGALQRARHPLKQPPPRSAPQPRYDAPAPDLVPDDTPTESILNPFSVYRKGEAMLRRQLAALSVWHLANIARAHGLSDLSSAALRAMTPGNIIDLIVAAVQARTRQSGVR